MPVHKPYADDAANAIYNLLFADTPDLFDKPDAPYPALFASPLDQSAVARLAEDASIDARWRLLAFNRLRAEGRDVPSGELLGVIAEVALDEGLDTLAAYADGGVRYLNQAGGMVVIESEVAAVERPRRALFDAARDLVGHIGPWIGPRLAPPGVRRVRLSFLMADGLYFGEADMAAMAGDPMGAAVFNAAVALMSAVVDFAARPAP